MNPAKSTDWDSIERMLLPILAEASIGDFSHDIVLPDKASRETKDILAGVQMLLEVIRQQQLELDTIKAQLEDARQRTSEILTEVLDRPLPTFKG